MTTIRTTSTADRRLLRDNADAALQVLTSHGRGVLGDLSPSRALAAVHLHSDNENAIKSLIRSRVAELEASR